MFEIECTLIIAIKLTYTKPRATVHTSLSEYRKDSLAERQAKSNVPD